MNRRRLQNRRDDFHPSNTTTKRPSGENRPFISAADVIANASGLPGGLRGRNSGSWPVTGEYSTYRRNRSVFRDVRRRVNVHRFQHQLRIPRTICPLGETRQSATSRIRSASAAKAAGNTFSATSRPSRLSRARYTSPIPPAPTADKISYGPEVSPTVAEIIIQWMRCEPETSHDSRTKYPARAPVLIE